MKVEVVDDSQLWGGRKAGGLSLGGLTELCALKWPHQSALAQTSSWFTPRHHTFRNFRSEFTRFKSVNSLCS